jgi:hypothetical protein
MPTPTEETHTEINEREAKELANHATPSPFDIVDLEHEVIVMLEGEGDFVWTR